MKDKWTAIFHIFDKHYDTWYDLILGRDLYEIIVLDILNSDLYFIFYVVNFSILDML